MPTRHGATHDSLIDTMNDEGQVASRIACLLKSDMFSSGQFRCQPVGSI